MHVLIIPSEEFQPPGSHLAGIFQLHQGQALAAAGHRVGMISVRLVYSVPMLLKGAFVRLLGGKGSAKLPVGSAMTLCQLLWSGLFRLRDYVTHEVVDQFPVVRVQGLYRFWPSSRFDHMGWLAAGQAAFAAYVARHGRPDIIHAHNALYAGTLAQILSRKSGIPYLMTEHSSYLTRQLYPAAVMAMAAKCIAGAAEYAVVSTWLGRKLEELFGAAASRWRWVPNVVDPKLQAFKQASPVSAPFTFLAIGDLIPIKDHRTLLSAFARRGELGECRLRIAGDGLEEANLRALTIELSIADRVEFLGRLPRERVAEELDRCDCFTLTSKMETFGVVLIEALARGCPVIATDCGGPADIVNPKTGRIVPVGDVDRLADAMCWMKTNARGFVPEELRTEAVERFGPAALVERLEALYDDVLKVGAEHA